MTGGTLRMQFEILGAGPPLVVIGGGLTGWASWRPLLPRLEGRKVILLQPLNVQLGLESRPLPANYSVRTEAAALLGALDAAAVTAPVDVLAWSYGAFATLTFALDNPGRVRSLTLIEPPAVWTLPDHGRADPQVVRLERLISSPADEVTEQMLETFLQVAGFVPPGGDARQLPQWPGWLGFRQSLRNTLAVFAHDDELGRVRAFKQPVLLVTGTGTSPFLRKIIDTLGATFPNARVLELPAGHGPQLVSADRFFAELREFLASTR